MTQVLFFLLFSWNLAFAQVDPSTAILLRSGGRPPAKENLDSSRYTIRPQKAPTPRSESIPTTNNFSAEQARPGILKNSEVSGQKKETSSPPAQETTPASPGEEQAKATEPEALESISAKGRKLPEEFIQQVKDQLWEGGLGSLKDYRKEIHPRDARLNLVRMSVAPGFQHLKSKSGYTPRRLESVSPGLGLGVEFWPSPFLGFRGRYETSLGATTVGEPGQPQRLKLSSESYGLQLEFRKYFSNSIKSPVLGFGIGYEENQLKVPKSNSVKLSSKTSGLLLSLRAELPTSQIRRWTFGVDLMPGLAHKETATGFNGSSGKKPSTYGVGLHFGQEFNFDGSHFIYWNLRHRSYSSYFEGTATVKDPVLEDTPSGVSVQSNQSLFEIGYRWGGH